MPIYDLGLEHVSLAFATKTIFTDVTQGVFEGDRIGIVGRNGDGKSTLLRLLSEEMPPDDGRVMRRGGLSLGILDQRDSLDDQATVRAAALENREDHEWASDARSRDIVQTLLGGMSLDARIGDLSGGQRRRADLARLLLHDWDIIALDEPTNHLDIVTIHWLAEHLKNRWGAGAGALLVVTHDRWFLDEVCQSMWEIHDGLIDPFEGGYSAYMLQRVERDRQADVAEEKRRNLARKELAWLTRGARARATKQKFHVKEAETLIADVPPMRNSLELKQMATSRLGKQVMDLKNVTKTYPLHQGEAGAAESAPAATPVAVPLPDTAAYHPHATGPVRTVLDDVTWLIGPGDRFGIVGANGAGKSTLLGIMDGTITPTKGHVRIGKTVKFAILSQRLDEIEALGDARVKEVLSRYKTSYIVDGKEVSPAQLLERLGFESAQLMTPVSDLSGGQKRRLQLLLILLDEPNVMIMDEPGNDLDTDMLGVMEDLLDTWPGTLIVVSHDRFLLERVTDAQFALLGGKVQHLPGGVDDYLAMVDDTGALTAKGRAALATAGGTAETSVAGTAAEVMGADVRTSAEVDDKEMRQKKYDATKRISAIERKLAKIEQNKGKIEQKMAAAAGSDFAALETLNKDLQAADSERGDLEAEWMELSEFVED
jgi:ATPase subunit of ABC transporter with duplicated ATPase domains